MAEFHILNAEEAENKGEGRRLPDIYCGFRQYFSVIIDTFSVSKLLFSYFCHSLILQVYLFNLSNIPVHQREMVTNLLIKSEFWKTVIRMAALGSKLEQFKWNLNFMTCFHDKNTPRKDLGASETWKTFTSILRICTREEVLSVFFDTSALFKVLLSTDFLNPPTYFSFLFHLYSK